MIAWYSHIHTDMAFVLSSCYVSYQMLHLYAVERILSDLKPPIDAKRKSGFSPERSLRVWLKSLREMSNAIESTLSLPSDHPIAFRSRYALCCCTQRG